MTTLTLDPSGNFDEGKGTTGWALWNRHCSVIPVNVGDMALHDFGEVKATDYETVEGYWQAIGHLICTTVTKRVVCESFRLFHHKAKEQGGSRLETPQLIGYLRMLCYVNGIEFIEQAPSDKTPVNDERLTRQGVFEQRGRLLYCNGQKTNLHMRDAIRHGVYYFRFGEGRKHATANNSPSEQSEGTLQASE